MENAGPFKDYYFKYLGILPQDLNSNNNVFECSHREKPINNWYFQHLIVTNIDKVNVFSVTPKMYCEFDEYITPFSNMDIEKLTEVLRIFFDRKFKKYSIRRMYRMTLDIMPRNSIIDKKVVRLTKEILMNSLRNVSDNEKSRIWQRKEKEVSQGRQYVILDNDKIVSYCKVSDIDYDIGNLTVFTDEKYRNKGYGKLVTTGAIKWCYENGIVPVYLVDNKNTASVALARGLGFKIRSEEIVVGTNPL